MRSLHTFIAIAITIGVAGTAIADGKVFRRGVAELPPIPDQQAIIAWDDTTSTETMAIETRFAAATPAKTGVSGGDAEAPYAWVVPLPGPGAPQITAATTGLFPTVREVFQPRVIDSTSPDGLFFSLPLAAVLLLGVWMTKIRKLNALVSILLLLLGFTCVGGLLLPSLGAARGSAGGPRPRDVDVLDRSIVGSYEVAVVGAGDTKDSGAALASWLNTEGFALPASARPILADYAARKWVFAAVKLRPHAGSDGRSHLTPHPLIFRFKSDGPIYPMRLTGFGNGPLSLDLYVFGAERAAAAGMTEVRCDECLGGREYEEDVTWRIVTGGVLAIAHPALREIVGKQRVGTKLAGTLSPQEQAADLRISWASYQESGGVKHSPRSAVYSAVEKAGLLFSGLVVVLVIIGAVARKDGAWVFRRLGWAVGPAMVLALVVWAMTPTVPIIPDGRSKMRDQVRLLSDFSDGLVTFVSDAHRAGTVPTVESVRLATGSITKKIGLDVKEEDSPLNYRIVAGEGEGGIDLLLYNSFGFPVRQSLWPPDREK